MKTILRVVYVLASVVAIAAAGAGGVRAADPVLGASIESSIFLSDNARMTILNRSTVEARFDLSSADGWTLTPSSVVLAPDESTTVDIGGSAPDGSRIAVVVRATASAPPGHSESILQLEARVYHARPFDPSPWIWRTLFAAIVATTVVIVLRRTRPWEYRVARRPS